MSLFRTTPTNDLDRGPLGTGFSRVRGAEEARVALRTVMCLIQPECKRDTRAGIDLEFLLDPLVSDDVKANHLASVAANVPGITDVRVRFDLDTSLGQLTVDADVTYDEPDQVGQRSRRERFLINVSEDVGNGN